MEKTFYVMTGIGIKRIPIIEEFEHLGRKLILHNTIHQEKNLSSDKPISYSVSDFLTGLLLSSNRYKIRAKESAINKLNKGEKENKIDILDDLDQVNSEEYQAGFTTTLNRLIQCEKEPKSSYNRGMLMAWKVFNQNKE